MNVRDIKSHIEGTFYIKEETTIESIKFDSRLCKKNTLFVALTEGKTDGHEYIEKALENGASTILISDKKLAEKYKGKLNVIVVKNTLKSLQELASSIREKLNIPFICITGSNGKTTTKDIVSSVLSVKYQVYKTPKNYNNHIGLPLSIVEITERDQVAVLELGMNHFNEMDLLGSIARPDIGVIINIGEAHIENFGSREGIAKAKGELLAHVNKSGLTVLNQEDDYYSFLNSLSKTEVVPYSTAGLAYNATKKGTEFEYQGEFYFLPLFGKHNVSNAICAIEIARRLGLTKEEIKKGLSQVEVTGMRFEQVKIKNNLFINDAYNASPSSMKASIRTFLELYKTKSKVIVLGDMYELGDQSVPYHQEIGEFLQNHLDHISELITIGEASEYISKVYRGKSKHFKEKTKAKEYTDTLQEKVILLKASRGMKLEELLR